jgi:hypothetical protein
MVSSKASASEATTFVGYGQIPARRQTKIMRGFGKPRLAAGAAGLDAGTIAAL